MALTFDATLKDMARDSPVGLLTTFDRPPTAPVKVLNVDLSAVTRAADLVLGLGDPPAEIVQIDFQASAAPWKHADVMVYHALLFAQYHVPVHTIVLLLRPEAVHSNMSGVIQYAPRPEHGKMDFGYQLVRLWERPAEELLGADLGVAPLAMLGRLPAGLPLEDGLVAIAQRLAERVVKEAPTEQAQKLLTEALLLTGLRVRRDVAQRVFRGVRAMDESDTFLMILEEGEAKHARKLILRYGAERLGAADQSVRTHLEGIKDVDRLDRMIRRAEQAGSWDEILATP